MVIPTAFVGDASSRDMPVEVQRLARTVQRWRSQILAWHTARVTNGPTEAMNNLAKRITRIAFGFRTSRHFRVRALLSAGRPGWSRLDTIAPR